MATTGDPVGSGFVNSLARPEGNTTGLSNLGGALAAKLLDLLISVVPGLHRVAVLVTPTSTTYRAITEDVQDGARQAGVMTLLLEVSSASDIEKAFTVMARDNADGVIVAGAPLFTRQRQQIAELGLKYRLPLVSGNRSITEAGGLMSYATKFTDNYARAAIYVDKILKGARPADLPVEQSTTLELVVNLRTAKAIGVKIPHSIVVRADDILH